MYLIAATYLGLPARLQGYTLMLQEVPQRCKIYVILYWLYSLTYLGYTLQSYYRIDTLSLGIREETQIFPENRWRYLTAFPCKILDSVFNSDIGTGIAASSHRGATVKGTKASDLYEYFKYFFLTFLGNFGSSPSYIHIITAVLFTVLAESKKERNVKEKRLQDR
jgi:hypothetical protein